MFTSEDPILTLPGPWGVRIDILPSFGILLVLFVGFQPTIWSVAIFAIVALSILLHELGHAWGNLVQGLSVNRVALWGGGGFCEGDPRATASERELVVAMGPIVNLALWAICSIAALQVEAANPDAARYDLVVVAWLLAKAAWINLWLFGFNMIPVHPLDGGKLFLLGLFRICDRRRAAFISGAVGLVLSILWVPAMIASFLLTGHALMFVPSIALHREMMRTRAVL